MIGSHFPAEPYITSEQNFDWLWDLLKFRSLENYRCKRPEALSNNTYDNVSVRLWQGGPFRSQVCRLNRKLWNR